MPSTSAKVADPRLFRFNPICHHIVITPTATPRRITMFRLTMFRLTMFRLTMFRLTIVTWELGLCKIDITATGLPNLVIPFIASGRNYYGNSRNNQFYRGGSGIQLRFGF
jgi:hypothetical protein